MKFHLYCPIIFSLILFPLTVLAIDERAQIDLDQQLENMVQEGQERSVEIIEFSRQLDELENQHQEAAVIREPYIRYYRSYEKNDKLEDRLLTSHKGPRDLWEWMEEFYEAFEEGMVFSNSINESVISATRNYYKVFYDGYDRLYRWEEISRANGGVIRYCKYEYDDMGKLMLRVVYVREENPFQTAAVGAYVYNPIIRDSIEYYQDTIRVQRHFIKQNEYRYHWYFYTPENLLIQHVEFNNQTVLSYRNYYYDEAGKLIKKEQYFNNQLTYYYQYHYVSERLTRKQMYSETGQLIKSYYY